MTRDYYQLPKSSPIMRFLWKCAGGDRYLLERATYSDQIKYMCLGGIVFATGAMAGLAGGYAFYTIFSPKSLDAIDRVKTSFNNPDYIPVDPTTVLLSIIFGIIWGLIIFNIDRFIVTSTGKGDGTEKITSDEIKSAIPRIIMGMIIAITISKPIEIRMFQSEIDGALQQYQDSIVGIKSVNADKKFANLIKPYQDKINPLINQINIKERRKVFLDSMVSYETANGGCKGKCEENKNERERILNEIKEIKETKDYVYNDNMIEAKKKELDIEKGKFKKEKSALNGLLIRIQLAHKISGFWISLFITLLFMAIELTPIFFKLMLTKSTYDYLAENRDELLKADYGIEVKYDYYKAKKDPNDKEGKEGAERHLTINHEAERIIFEKKMVTNIQKELTKYAVTKYKEREMKKIDDNLDDYIKGIDG